MERQSRRRRRPARSCIECRRRKIKCDRNDPCAHCVSARSQCTYNVYRDAPTVRNQAQRGSSRPSASSPRAYPHSPLAQAQRINTNRPSDEYENPSRPPTEATGQPPDDLCNNGVRPLNAIQGAQPDIQNILQRVQKLKQSSTSSSTHGLSETGRDIFARQSGLQDPQDSQIVVNKTRISGWSLQMGKSQEFAPILACCAEIGFFATRTSLQDAETGVPVDEARNIYQQCKSMARSIKVGRPSRRLSCPKFDLTILSREVADTMATMYFRSLESIHRILHVPTFWAEYQRYWNNPESAPIDLRLKILLVIGIGSSLYEHEDTDAKFRDMVSQWVYTAQTWLSGPLEKDRLGISGLQIHCLTIIARQIFSIGGDLVWVSMGSLIHRAMQIGLHRDPKHLPPISVLQAELRRRLWATILEMTVQSSLDSAMPPRISLDEFDTEAPSNNNDNEIDESTTVLQPHPKGIYTSTSFQLLLLNSLPTRLRILRLLTSLRSELSYLDVLALSSEITDAYRACSSFIKENEESDVTSFHRNLLDYLVRRFMIPLHCPLLVKARTNPLFHYSLKVSLDLAMAIISPEPDEGFSRLMAIGGGLFREGIRYAGAVISFELLAQVEAQRLDGTLHRNPQYKELLKQAVRDMISLSSERIRQGETNVKNHMFLSMVMAHAEAIEAGDPCQPKIAQSARDSLEFCHGLLETQAETAPLPYHNDTGLESTSLTGGEENLGDLDLEFFLPDVGFY